MPIIYDEKKRVFKLDTPNTTYAFHVTNSNHLLHLYYGASIPETDITHMLRIPNDEPFVPSTHDGMGPHSFDCAAIEFPTSGVADFREPCMQLMDKYGMSACECYYASYAIYRVSPRPTPTPTTKLPALRYTARTRITGLRSRSSTACSRSWTLSPAP